MTLDRSTLLSFFAAIQDDDGARGVRRPLHPHLDVVSRRRRLQLDLARLQQQHRGGHGARQRRGKRRRRRQVDGERKGE